MLPVDRLTCGTVARPMSSGTSMQHPVQPALCHQPALCKQPLLTALLRKKPLLIVLLHVLPCSCSVVATRSGRWTRKTLMPTWHCTRCVLGGKLSIQLTACYMETLSLRPLSSGPWHEAWSETVSKQPKTHGRQLIYLHLARPSVTAIPASPMRQCSHPWHLYACRCRSCVALSPTLSSCQVNRGAMCPSHARTSSWPCWSGTSEV